MESKRPRPQPSIESTPATSSEEVQSRNARELQDSAPKPPEPRGFEGRRHTPEARAKISEANKGKKLSPETKAKISAAQKGKKVSPETRSKLSEANKGKKYTQETKAKISEAMSGEKNYQYDQSIDQVRLAIIDCVLGESQSQASRNQGFEHNWLASWKCDHRQRFDALYLEAATGLDQMVTNDKIGSLALELAAGSTRQELARYLLVSSESSLQPDSQD